MKPYALISLVSVLPAIAADPRGDHPDAAASTPEQQRAMFHLPPGFEIQLVAAEPEIQKPLNLTFDAAGRLWVTGSEMYPWPAGTDAQGLPIPGFAKAYQDLAGAFGAKDSAPPPSITARDTVRVLGDFDDTGHARTVSVFADGLNIPSGVQPLPRKPGAKGDSVIVYSIPNIYRFDDTDGDGRADHRELLYGTAGYLDTHGGTSSFLHWIDGWIYGTHGFRNHSEIRDKSGRVTVLDSGNTYRFRPDGSAFEIYSHGQTNPFGLTTDSSGNFYSADSHSKPVYMLLRGAWYEGIGKQHDGLGFAPRITDDDHGSTAIAGITCYTANAFPEPFHGNLFNGNPVTQRINRDALERHGSTPKAIRQPDFLTCDDPWFRPVQVKLGPDGALYIADFYNPIIGHYEFPLADPRRDHSHGRIWRVVWKGAPTTTPDLTQSGTADLLGKLADPNLIIRTQATHELVDRIGPDAAPALEKLLADPTAPSFARSHALWAVERLKSVDDTVLTSLLSENSEATEPLRIQTCKLLADRPTLTTAQERLLADAIIGENSRVARAAAGALGLHPCDASWALLERLNHTSPEDRELIHTLRMALRDVLKVPGNYDKVESLDAAHPEYAAAIADVSLGLPTADAATFLLNYLHRHQLEGARADEFLHHVCLYLPEEKFGAIEELLGTADKAPMPVKLGLAENLSTAGRQRGLALPPPVAGWIHLTLLEALGDSDALVKRAVEGLRELKLDAKLEPLSRLAGDSAKSESIRAAALEALANAAGSNQVLARELRESPSLKMRKTAAGLLGRQGQDSVQPLIAALPSAPADLATIITASLVAADTSCDTLLALIESGKASPSLLRNPVTAAGLSQRGPSLRDRAALLTHDLPPEDARLDDLIAKRIALFQKAQTDATRGTAVFATHCAVCHHLQNTGGNIGPALDGIGNRGVHRLAEDILDPNRNVDPIFRQTLITTIGGQVLSGLNLQEHGELLTLTDASGKAVSSPKAEVKETTTSRLSLMPTSFESAIPEADFHDLLAYLLSCREK